MIKINIFQPKFFKLLNLVICLNINIVKFFSDTFNCEKGFNRLFFIFEFLKIFKMLYKYYINLIFKYLDLMITLCQIKNIRSNLRMYTFITKSKLCKLYLFV